MRVSQYHNFFTYSCRSNKYEAHAPFNDICWTLTFFFSNIIVSFSNSRKNDIRDQKPSPKNFFLSFFKINSLNKVSFWYLFFFFFFDMYSKTNWLRVIWSCYWRSTHGEWVFFDYKYEISFNWVSNLDGFLSSFVQEPRNFKDILRIFQFCKRVHVICRAFEKSFNCPSV